VWLDNLLEEFFLFLKNNNFKVNTVEKILILKSISFIDITDKNQLFSAFYSIIVKNELDFDRFNYLFDIFFKTTDFKKKENIIYSDKNSSINSSVINSILSSYKLSKYDYNSILKYFILSNEDKLNRLIRLAVSNLNNIDINNIGNSFNKVKNSLNIENLEDDIQIFKKELLNKGADSLEIDIIINKIMNNLKIFKKKIRISLKQKVLEHKIKTNTEIDINNLEINTLEEIAKNITDKLNKTKTKRYKKSSNGIIDIRKTLHKSVSYNQIPLKRIYKKQKIKKRNLIILADTSDSVIKYSRILLYFIYSLNKFFNDIKTFTFVSEIEEITEYFNNDNSFNEVISSIKNKGGNSDYNSSFELFSERYTSILNKNTIFIIIGDARNNYFPADFKNLIQIQKKVKDIIWLNPENKFLWDTSDSNMKLYKKVIKNIYQVKTIEDIKLFSEEIIFK